MNLLRELSLQIEAIIRPIIPTIVEIESAHRRSRLNPMRVIKGEEVIGGGAGIVFKKNGFIVTNYHVVKDAIEGDDRLTVKIPDGRRFEAKITGHDQISDIAVLKVSAHDLMCAKLKPDIIARLGEIVFAIGHPLGLSSSVTMGIVGSEARFDFGPDSPRPAVYIQTDAPINSGNSGGALVNSDGQIVGMTSWGVEAPYGVGLNFAIPVSRVVKVAEQLSRSRKFTYGTIGISGFESDLPAQAVASHGLPQGQALLIQEVTDESPAEKVGIERGDWLLAIDNKPVETLESFLSLMEGDAVGKRVNIRILRGSNFAVCEKKMQIIELEAEEE
jgi:serine protease DegS